MAGGGAKKFYKLEPEPHKSRPALKHKSELCLTVKYRYRDDFMTSSQPDRAFLQDVMKRYRYWYAVDTVVGTMLWIWGPFLSQKLVFGIWF
jgi:hypothetical protein